MKEKENVSIGQLKVLADYNQQIRGVYLQDNGISNYWIIVKGKSGGGPICEVDWQSCKLVENIQFSKQIKNVPVRI